MRPLHAGSQRPLPAAPTGSASIRLRTVLLTALVCLAGGCSTISQHMPAQREAAARAEQLQQTQLRVMRFADEYAGRVREATAGFQATQKTPGERLAVQGWKVQQCESAYTIASGPNALVNALDMVVLATLSRMVIEDVWMKEGRAERARPVLDVHQSLEERAWRLLEGLLTEAQSAQLREVIAEWRQQHPEVRFVAYIHFTDFAKSVGAPKPGEERSSGNLFSMLGLDPFKSLDPAVREIAQTRELAERTIFYMQRMPGLLDMQIEKLTYTLAVMPETKALLADLNRASLVGSAADRVAETFPDVIARERQALISQLMQEIDSRREMVGSLSGELRSMLEAGTETSNSLHATLETLDRITARYAAKGGPADAGLKGPPFDIRDYTQMIRELSTTTRDLNALAQSVDSTLPAVRRATQDAAGTLEQVMNHFFLQLLLLVVVTVVLITLAALAYRALAVRMQRRSGPSNHAPETELR